jgi:hypothetical protein
LRIDTSKVGDARVFRTRGVPRALLVAEEVKVALERTGATGLKFTEVTGPSPISDEERAYKRRCNELLDPPPAARRAAWKSLGTLDELAVAPRAICYEWPGQRQDWAIIHREAGHLLLVSEGLSDPFIARHVRERVKAGLVALEVAGTGLPASLVTTEERVGVLLGLESRSLPRLFPTPFGDVRLVTVKALLPTELEYMSKRDGQGMDELARRFAETGEEHVSRSSRQPVV